LAFDVAAPRKTSTPNWRSAEAGFVMLEMGQTGTEVGAGYVDSQR
jgi:hypothetical protein